METKNIIKVERIHHLNGEGSTKAFCDVLVGDSFLVKGLRIIEGKDGLFVSMPREEGKDGKWYDTVFPISRELREETEKLVLQSFKNEPRR